MKKIVKYNVHNKQSTLSFRLVLLLLIFSALPAVSQQAHEATASHATAAAFKSLWQACIIKGSIVESNAALLKFKTAVAGDKKLSPQLREELSKISLDCDQRFVLPSDNDQAHPAVGVINFLSNESTFSKGRKWTYELYGRVSEDIEYGFFQETYDSYLSEINAYSGLVTTARVGSAPKLSMSKLVELQSIFKQLGDVHWELKTLRWQLGGSDPSELMYPDAANKWMRLGQLETGEAGELDRFFCQVSLIARNGNVILPGEKDLDGKPIPGERPTKEQCAQAIQLMIDMKMPWEAFYFLRHSKERWGIEPVGSLEKIEDSWAEDIGGRSGQWEKYYSRPLFISTVKVAPATTFEEFLKEFETRPSLSR